MKVELNEIIIGVQWLENTKYFKDLTEATLFASEKISKGYEIKMLYCNKYGCEIQ